MVSGSDREDVIFRMAKVIADNPSISIPLAPRRDRDARSPAEREVWRLAQQVGLEQTFPLGAVVTLVARAFNIGRVQQQILVSPREIEQMAPLGAGFNYLGDYLDGIVRAARRDIILMTPFWDVATLKSVFASAPRASAGVEVVLLLVDAARVARSVDTIVTTLMSVWAPSRLRVFVHRVSGQAGSEEYPHAKCLLVDRETGYLGSANFTEAGLGRRFELGVSIHGSQAACLSRLLEGLWASTGMFKLAWDTHGPTR